VLPFAIVEPVKTYPFALLDCAWFDVVGHSVASKVWRCCRGTVKNHDDFGEIVLRTAAQDRLARRNLFFFRGQQECGDLPPNGVDGFADGERSLRVSF
jgi:hypothetical protein